MMTGPLLTSGFNEIGQCCALTELFVRRPAFGSELNILSEYKAQAQ